MIPIDLSKLKGLFSKKYRNRKRVIERIMVSSYLSEENGIKLYIKGWEHGSNGREPIASTRPLFPNPVLPEKKLCIKYFTVIEFAI
jgi:hypothetical protein